MAQKQQQAAGSSNAVSNSGLMGSLPDISLVYIVTSCGDDNFANMALVSMLSARKTNPSSKIVLICDEGTARSAAAHNHRMLHVCNELVTVDVPPGHPTFVNRWMKTQARKWIEGPFLLVDTDTLIRAPLDELLHLVAHMGAVPNHNTDTVERQVWREDLEEVMQMGWGREFAAYWNGGVLFFQQTETVENFFKLWHARYLQSAQHLRRYRDQPALNTAIRDSFIPITRLPDRFNFQIRDICKRWSDAAIWHYYSSAGLEGTMFGEIVDAASKLSANDLNLRVTDALALPHPFLSGDEVACAIAKQVDESGCITVGQTRWLRAGSLAERLNLATSAAELQSRLDECADNNEQLRAAIAALRASASWRLTSPYRASRRLLNRILARVFG
jgi:hypothetical protein